MTHRAPSPPPTEGPPRDYAFSDADFAVIARRAHRDFGLHLPATKKDLVYSRLIKRLRHLGLKDFRSYCEHLEAPDGEAERAELLCALTTNVTHFFREEHHFAHLRDTVLPPLVQAARKGGRVRLWSAGCSAGQEPYSLAFTVLDLCPEADRLDIRILATDIDPVILSKAERGVYPLAELKAIPERLRDRFVERLSGEDQGFSIAAQARSLVRFGVLNLMQDWPMRGPFDAIFCRNVAIYFDKETQDRLWHRFAGLLPEGGHLFIGHSERVAGRAEGMFRPVAVTTYRRVAARTGAETTHHTEKELGT